MMPCWGREIHLNHQPKENVDQGSDNEGEKGKEHDDAKREDQGMIGEGKEPITCLQKETIADK